ncbi:hypothetical protein XH94_37180 [Bradyrhizobium zhanjiangense]|uniref:Uncharacterized protein n=1 Tax=Bradyrhizobium zhanjiangense TaxID=1325107 RepID=A0A4Q0RUJ0_9BRAD|nr:hypothetical protein XH94_37180 [Bradyrhizobium zhanjiangense]
MLRSFRLAAQEIAEFDVCQSTARRRIGLMNNESMAIGRLAPEKPGIAVGTSIELTSFAHLRLPVGLVL